MSDAPTTPSPATTTRLSGNWMLKQGVFLTILLVFGFWGLADALYFYPRRGLEDASSRLWDYFKAASDAGKLTPADLALPDPQAAYAELAPRMEELARASTAAGTDSRLAKVEFAKARWLEALSRTWRLTTEPQVVIGPGQLQSAPTRMVKYDPVKAVGLATSQPGETPTEISPQKLLGELTQKWNARDQVTPLSGYDMPLQWVFVIVGFGGGAWMLLTMVRAASTRFRWEPEPQALTLPNGKRFVPADVKEFDKRRWHKFFVTVHLKDGTSHTLDLLRYVPLEEWVLTMEKTAFPESAGSPSPALEPVPAGNAAADNPNN
jgi:hypothetical protein